MTTSKLEKHSAINHATISHAEVLRPTHVEVDLARLSANYRAIQAHVAPAAVMPILKANAYGHGIERAYAGLRGADGFALLDLAEAERIRAERDALFERLRELRGVEAFPSAANFVLVRVPDAEALNARLLARRILVRNFHGSHPLLANCLRLTVGTPGENELLLDALTASL